MGKVYDRLDDSLVSFIGRQHVFFVGTAPTDHDGHINISPKGLDTFRILGPDSVAASRVSDAFRKLAPEKYAQFHHTLLGSDGRASEDSAIEVATSLGVTEAAIRAEMAKSPNNDMIKATYQLATDLNVTGTPAYIIGNETISGAIGLEAIQQKIANVRSCGKTTC